jgi:hypothetical protein
MGLRTANVFSRDVSIARCRSHVFYCDTDEIIKLAPGCISITNFP